MHVLNSSLIGSSFLIIVGRVGCKNMPSCMIMLCLYKVWTLPIEDMILVINHPILSLEVCKSADFKGVIENLADVTFKPF